MAPGGPEAKAFQMRFRDFGRLDLRKTGRPRHARTDMRQQPFQARAAVLDEAPRGQHLRRILYIDAERLDAPVRRDAEALNLVLPRRQGLDGTLPADRRPSL